MPRGANLGPPASPGGAPGPGTGSEARRADPAPLLEGTQGCRGGVQVALAGVTACCWCALATGSVNAAPAPRSARCAPSRCCPLPKKKTASQKGFFSSGGHNHHPCATPCVAVGGSGGVQRGTGGRCPVWGRGDVGTEAPERTEWGGRRRGWRGGGAPQGLWGRRAGWQLPA